MNKNVANIILLLFIGIWAIINGLILFNLLSQDSVVGADKEHIVQVLLSMLGSSWLFMYILRFLNKDK